MKTQGSQIVIGQVDTGLDPNHPELNEIVCAYKTIDRNGLIGSSLKGGEVKGHGTEVARLMQKLTCQENCQDQPRIRISAVSIPKRGKILLNILTAMDAFLAQQINILYIPFGLPQQTPLFKKAIDRFCQKGVLVIAPTGNVGPGTVLAPASHPQVLAVGALGTAGGAASYSGSKSDAAGICIKPDILAPYENPESINTTEGDIQGTSMAGAYVAGVAATLFQANPMANAQAVKEALLTTCKKSTPPTSAYGVLQPAAALEHIRQKRVSDVVPTKYTAISSDLREPFIDTRLCWQWQDTGFGGYVESIVIAQSTAKLMQSMTTKFSTMIKKINILKHVDAAHLIASPKFYRELLQQKNLLVCSAVNLNHFDMNRGDH